MELNKRIGAVMLFFTMLFIQCFQFAAGKRDTIDVTYPTRPTETTLYFDGRYNTTRASTTVITTTEPPTQEGYIPAGSDEDLWSISFGGTGEDVVRSIYYCANGDYVICGNSTSDDMTFTGLYVEGTARPYAFVAKFSSSGSLRWINSIYGNNICIANDVCELSDGSIAVAGYTRATNLITSAPLSSSVIDAFIFRYSSTGDVLNKYVAEGSGYDYFYSISPCPDGGYVAGGSSTSTDGDFNMTSTGAVLIKFNSSNAIVSSVTLNGGSGGTIHDVSVDTNGTVFAACVTTSSDGDFAQFSGLGAGKTDSLVLKYSSDLSVLRWSVVIAGGGNDRFEYICADNDGGCVVAGNFETKNNAGVTDGFFAGYPNYGYADGYAVRINSVGTVTGRRGFGGSQIDYITGVCRCSGSYVFCGYTKSSDFNFSTLGNIGGYDSFVTVVSTSDFSGSAVSVHPIAGTDSDTAFAICGSGYVYTVAGTTSSTDEFFWTTDPMVTQENTGFAVKYELES